MVIFMVAVSHDIVSELKKAITRTGTSGGFIDTHKI